MSISELERFSADLRANKELQNAITGIGTDIDALVTLANDKGYDFTKDEMLERIKDKCSDQLSDEQLDNVAGGGTKESKCKPTLINTILGIEAVGDAIL